MRVVVLLPSTMQFGFTSDWQVAKLCQSKDGRRSWYKDHGTSSYLFLFHLLEIPPCLLQLSYILNADYISLSTPGIWTTS